MTAVIAQGDAVWGVAECHRRPLSGEQALDIGGVGGIAAEEPMLSQAPEIAWLAPRLSCRLLQRGIQIEGFRPFALLADLQAAQQIANLVVAETGPGEIHVACGPELREEAG